MLKLAVLQTLYKVGRPSAETLERPYTSPEGQSK